MKRTPLDIVFDPDRTITKTPVIQIHPPKGAGTSFSKTLGITDHHYPAAYLKAHNPSLFSKMFVYGLIRNPWDRMESWWRYHEHRDHASFAEWADKGFKCMWTMGSLNARILHQEDWLEIDGEIELDLLIRFESLQEGFDRLVDILGIQESVGPLQHINKNNKEFEIVWTDVAYRKSLAVVGEFADNYEYTFERSKIKWRKDDGKPTQ